MDYENTDAFKIMLSHRPDSFVFGQAADTWKIDLVVSGHVHGGQVRIPCKGGLYGGDQDGFLNMRMESIILRQWIIWSLQEGLEVIRKNYQDFTIFQRL